ncbi:MAG: MFS transporter [Pseudobdellovibrionaceae bacterium]
MSLKMIVSDKKFWPLFWTQFLGALNDNFLKNSLLVLITFKGISIAGMQTDKLVAFASGIFILPFFLFSPLAGQFADKFEKSQLVRYTKIWELGIMVLASLGFYFECYWLLLCILFLIGVQSTFFGPVKFSIIPQIVKSEQLVESNAYVELGTFLAILVGTIAGGIAVASPNVALIVSIVLLTVSALGVWTSLKLPPVPIGNPNLKISLNPIPSFKEMWILLREKKAIFNSILGVSWFWFFGATVLSVLPIYCKSFLGANEQVVTAFLAMFTIGIGVGSIICEKLSFERVEIGLVPLGSLGMTIFLFDLFRVTPHWSIGSELMGLEQFLSEPQGRRLLFDFFFTSVFGGFFIIPLYALVQERSHSDSRSRVIAANNVMNALFMVTASILTMIFYSLKLTFPQIFLILCVLNAAVAVYIYSIVPEFTLRFLSWILVHLLYRLKLKGVENLPKEGPIVLACNHVSFVDWLIVMGAIRRPTRFVMYYKFLEIPLLRYLMKQARVIPIAGRDDDPEILKNAYERIANEIKEGEVICIFPEGKITYDGELSELKPGILKIIEQNQIPVVPMAINNLWGSMFSRMDGPNLLRPPRKFWKTITLTIGQPIAPKDLTLEVLEGGIRNLMDPPSVKATL